MRDRARLVRVAALALGTLAARPAAGQRDSAAVPTLGTMVVTAERTATELRSSTSSVSRISAAELARTPNATLADVLQRVPGFAVVDFDGLGFDPQLMVRGFYGGGEAEYVQLLVDGTPVAQLQTGLVPWSALPPLSAIEAIEIVRGSASALYGDAAIGGVINIITRRANTGRAVRLDGIVGSFGTWRANAGLTGALAGHETSGTAMFDHTDGARAHAERDATTLLAGTQLVATAATQLRLGVRAFTQSFDQPGPLLDSLLALNRTASDVLFRFDRTHDASGSLTLDGDHRIGEGVRVSGSLGGEWRRTAAVTTLALAPGYGDTQARDAGTSRAAGTIQFDVVHAPLPGHGRLTAGAELARGALDSRYYGVASGDRDAYLAASGARGALEASGSTARTSGSLFEEYSVPLARNLSLSLGSRFDWLDDEFHPGAGAAQLTETHTAFSPKLGVNARYARGRAGSGNVYVTASEAFKAPTLDQLFDQRPIPVPFPPYSVTTANAALTPSRGTNVEAGVYHLMELPGGARVSAQASVYQMDMRDELDFDLTTFRYVNIGRSRHRGVEAGIVLSGAGGATVYGNYTLQAATSASGADAGKYLKAIPRRLLTGGVTVPVSAAFEANLSVTSTGGAFLDDANQRPLAGFTRVDARLSYGIGAVALYVEARNLLDAHYNTTGYLDPGGSGNAYFYPAAGRMVSAGLRRGW